jgi:hypothetical protein
MSGLDLILGAALGAAASATATSAYAFARLRRMSGHAAETRATVASEAAAAAAASGVAPKMERGRLRQGHDVRAGQTLEYVTTAGRTVEATVGDVFEDIEVTGEGVPLPAVYALVELKTETPEKVTRAGGRIVEKRTQEGSFQKVTRAHPDTQTSTQPKTKD